VSCHGFLLLPCAGVPMQRVRVLRSTYLDSVSLMRISKLAGDAPGVTNAVVSMATDTNLILMKNIGFDPAEAGEVSSSDLVIAVEAESRDALEGAFMLVENHIKGGPAAAVGGAAGAGASEGVHPGSLEAAMRQRPEIDLVLVSVPGQYAAYEAHKALLAGKHVMIFSDNVSVEDEKHLKDLGTRDGLLVMGPDCGTSIIGGVALGFANAVPRGQVGVVSASGTGAQEVSSILARMGVGISHIIGTGGRDVVRRIGAATMLTGLKALIDDPATDVIVLISKAPDPDVAERILAAARRSGKPCIICFMGRGPSGKQENLIFAGTLTEAALSVAGELTSSPLSDEKLLAFRATPGEAPRPRPIPARSF
jgi:FdrA protein